MKIYLSGPMSGYPEKNYPLFRQVAGCLEGDSHDVLDPSRNPDGKTRAQYMAMDVEMVMATNAVVCLPGWELSQGASLEVFLAYELCIPVYAWLPTLAVGRQIELNPEQLLIGSTYTLLPETL